MAFFLGGKCAFAQLENTTRDVARKHPNGKLKSNQYYTKGKENGVFLDYNESGKLVKQSLFKDGKLVSEQNF